MPPEQLPNQPNPSDIPTDTGIPAWHGVVFEAKQAEQRAIKEANDAKEELARLRVTQNPPEVLEAGVAFNDPERFARRITDDVTRQVKPLNDFVSETKRQQNYWRLKADIVAAATPDNRAAFEKIGHLIDSRFINDPSLEPTAANFNEVLTKVLGTLVLSGAFNQPAPVTPVNNDPAIPRLPNRDNVIPPNTRPSAPAFNNNEPAFDESRFTENERRLAREQNLTLREFSLMQDAPPEKAESVWRQILEARKARRA